MHSAFQTSARGAPAGRLAKDEDGNFDAVERTRDVMEYLCGSGSFFPVPTQQKDDDDGNDDPRCSREDNATPTQMLRGIIYAKTHACLGRSILTIRDALCINRPWPSFIPGT